MRVVAGTARSVMLETPAGRDTRPTTDRIKETLFNIIQAYCPGATILDLFAGSGGLGIEGLSRGAECAVLVDQSREAVKCITNNVNRCKLTDRAEILQMDFQSAVMKLKGKNIKFDLVFLDPPYDKGMEFEALRALNAADILTDDVLVVVETSIEHDGSEFENLGFDIDRIKVYKSNQHYFLRRNS